jgi:hypothetical protein
MYAHGKMRAVQTAPGMGEGGKKEMMDRVNSNMIHDTS